MRTTVIIEKPSISSERPPEGMALVASNTMPERPLRSGKGAVPREGILPLTEQGRNGHGATDGLRPGSQIAIM